MEVMHAGSENELSEDSVKPAQRESLMQEIAPFVLGSNAKD
jgi:hypothetical protein